MKRNALIVPAVLAALCLTTSAWAGGSMCSGKSEGASKETSATAKDHCAPGSKGASMTSNGQQCAIGANSAVFSFAVPDVHCGACVDKIQTTAMGQKGVLCAKVDLESKMAYVAGDKKMNQRGIAKAIKDAGYACTFKDRGPKARAELMKIMASSPAPTKKDKV
jgi:copper chaperone CopZ